MPEQSFLKYLAPLLCSLGFLYGFERNQLCACKLIIIAILEACLNQAFEFDMILWLLQVTFLAQTATLVHFTKRSYTGLFKRYRYLRFLLAVHYFELVPSLLCPSILRRLTHTRLSQIASHIRWFLLSGRVHCVVSEVRLLSVFMRHLFFGARYKAKLFLGLLHF